MLFRIFGSQVALRAYVLMFFCLGGGFQPLRGDIGCTLPLFLTPERGVVCILFRLYFCMYGVICRMDCLLLFIFCTSDNK